MINSCRDQAISPWTDVTECRWNDRVCHLFKVSILASCLLLSCLCSSLAVAVETGSDLPRWSVLTGYGSSHPGWGETEVRVETLDLVLRRSSIIVDDVGSSWYKGYHSLFVEIPLHFLLNPDDTPIIGLNFLASYTFTGFSLQPYLFGGGGPVYVDADIAGMGSNWNGNYQVGAGFSYRLNDDHALLLECRYHHISNGNSSEPNLPLNSTKFLVGYTF
jgi:hypothetical protein